MPAVIDDTYAEAFRSIYVEFLITARDPAVGRACGQRRHRQCIEHDPCATAKRASIASSARAAMNRSPRPTAGRVRSCSCTCRGFARTASKRLEHAALVRISQNVLTCPTAACFNLIDSRRVLSRWAARSPTSATDFKSAIERFGRKMWWIPTLGGEFVLDRRLGYADGLMGGNLWFFGETRGRRAGRGRGGRGRGSQVPRRDHAVSRRHRRQRIEGGQQVQIHDRQHLRKILPAAGRRSRGRLAAAGRRPLGDGNHHQRPRSGRDHPRHASGDRRLGRTRPACCASPPATTAAGSARALSICIPTSSRAIRKWCVA